MAFGQTKKETYVGLEEIWCTLNTEGKKDCYADPEYPNHKWFHLTKITFKGDSVFMDQSPIAIYKKDTIYSVSDGGFYFYRGTFILSNNNLKIDLKLDHCDYCPVPIKPKADYGIKKINAVLKGDYFEINSYAFKKIK